MLACSLSLLVSLPPVRDGYSAHRKETPARCRRYARVAERAIRQITVDGPMEVAFRLEYKFKRQQQHNGWIGAW
jgi:hypothetical protein